MTMRTTFVSVMFLASAAASGGCGRADTSALNELVGGTPRTDSLMMVPLGAHFQGALPVESGWTCAHEGSVTLLLHLDDNDVMDALVIAESGLPAPTAALGSSVFYREISAMQMVEAPADPGWAEALAACIAGDDGLPADGAAGALDPYGASYASVVDPYADPADTQSAKVPADASPAERVRACIEHLGSDGRGAGTQQALLATASRTQGQGLGFSPEPEGFTGWRAIGTFSSAQVGGGARGAAVDYRAGARRGYWQQPTKPEDGAETRSSGTVAALNIIGHFSPVSSDGTRGRTPTYISILCQSSDAGCTQGDALLTLLLSTHTGQSGGTARSACTGDRVEDLAEAHGFVLLGDASLRAASEAYEGW